MAYTLSQGTIAEILVSGTCNGQIVMSLFHYRMTSGSTIADGAAALGTVMSDFNTQVMTAYKNLMPENWEGLERSIQAIAPNRYRRIITSIAGQFGAGGTCNNQSAAGAITKYTDIATRAGLGTLHVPCIPDLQLQNGELAAGWIAAASTLAATMDNVLTSTPTASWSPVVYSRTSPATSPIITGLVVQNSIRTARRRVLRRGI